jgi:hypothetical protein
MTTALLDKIESALDHARPKDARRLLSELREELQAGPEPPAAGPPSGEPTIEIEERLGGGLTLRAPFPPRPETGYRLCLAPGQGRDGVALADATARGKHAWARLLDQYRDWSETRRF